MKKKSAPPVTGSSPTRSRCLRKAVEPEPHVHPLRGDEDPDRSRDHEDRASPRTASSLRSAPSSNDGGTCTRTPPASSSSNPPSPEPGFGPSISTSGHGAVTAAALPDRRGR